MLTISVLFADECKLDYKEHQRDIYVQVWSNDIEHSQRTRTYKSICSYRLQPV